MYQLLGCTLVFKIRYRRRIAMAQYYQQNKAAIWRGSVSYTVPKVLSLCVEKGMVRGKRQAVDSAYIKANASMDSLQEKEIIEDVELYASELNEGSEYKIKKRTMK